MNNNDIGNGSGANKGKKGFKYWFVNVFWYHYGKWTLAGLVALAVILFITLDSASRNDNYDFQMAICMDGGIAYDDTAEFLRVVEEAVGDINGDGVTLVDLQLVNLADEEYAETNQYKLMLLMSQPEYTMFIMDEKYSSLYCAKDYFDDLNRFGITPDKSFKSRVEITDTGAVKSIGTDFTFYTSICDWTTVGKGSQAATEAAVRVINALLKS